MGQTDMSDTDLEEQEARTQQMKANTERMRRETAPDREDGVDIINDV